MGYLEIAGLLLKYGVNVDEKDKKGMTHFPSIWAAGQQERQ